MTPYTIYETVEAGRHENMLFWKQKYIIDLYKSVCKEEVQI